MQGPYHAHRASRPKFHRAQTYSTLSELSQESNPVVPLNVSYANVAFFHTSSSCQTYLLFFELDQEIHCGPRTSPNHTFLYVADRNDMLQMCNYSFVNMNSPMHHTHQHYYKSSHTQARRHHSLSS
jgi:hypothetical protein